MENALFETHAHLDTFEDKELLKNVIEDSKNAGIKKIVVPAISYESNFYIRDLFYKEEFTGKIYQAVGLHPKCAINEPWNKNKKTEFERLLENKNVVAIKTGLDFAKTKLLTEQKYRQIVFLEYFINLAANRNLPLVFHIRDALDEFVETWNRVIKELNNKNLKTPKAEIHCYNGVSWKKTQELISMGICYFGIGGKITKTVENFDKDLFDAVKNLPKENILLETDTPYIFPEGYTMPLYLREFLEKNNKKSNKLNVPSTLVDVASKIAGIRNTSYSEIAEITYNNACDFFDLEFTI